MPPPHPLRQFRTSEEPAFRAVHWPLGGQTSCSHRPQKVAPEGLSRSSWLDHKGWGEGGQGHASSERAGTRAVGGSTHVLNSSFAILKES